MIVKHDMDVGELFDTMKSAWKLETPSLLISVIGGAKKFRMMSEQKDAFRHGLVKAAEITGNVIRYCL